MTVSTPRFECRSFKADDYPMLQGWWRGHGVLDVPPGYLPKCGIVVEADGVPAACGWLYLDNSCAMCWLAWVTTRPKLRPRAGLRALQHLLAAAEEAAKAQHRSIIFAEAPYKSLERFYVARGFVVNHPTVHLFKGVA